MPSLVTTLVALLAAVQAPSYAEPRVGGCDLDRTGLTRPVASLTAGTPSGSSYTYGETASDPSSQYNGRVYDPGTGFHDYGARMYWPQVGRFVSADSYPGDPANPASLNGYAYVANNPYKYTDPTGHYFESLADVAFIAYDLGSLAYHNMTGNYDAALVDTMALGIDLACLAAPVVTGGGVAFRLTTRVETKLYYAGTKQAGQAMLKAEQAGAREGIYEFRDAKAGVPYVGQSGDIAQRLSQHEKVGRIGSQPTVREVSGGKTAREVAEHKRIQEITGGVPARKSPNVANKVDPVGPKRQELLKKE